MIADAAVLPRNHRFVGGEEEDERRFSTTPLNLSSTSEEEEDGERGANTTPMSILRRSGGGEEEGERRGSRDGGDEGEDEEEHDVERGEKEVGGELSSGSGGPSAALIVGGKRSRTPFTPSHGHHHPPLNKPWREEVSTTIDIGVVGEPASRHPHPQEEDTELLVDDTVDANGIGSNTTGLLRRRRGPSIRRMSISPPTVAVPVVVAVSEITDDTPSSPLVTREEVAPTASTEPEEVVNNATEDLNSKVSKLIKDANSAYDFSRWADAFGIYSDIEKLTENGHVFYRLGMMHLVGYHVSRSTENSRVYFEKAFPHLVNAAEKSDPEAQADLGYMYYNGHTPDGQNINTAIQYYTLASNQNYSRALCNLGYIYYNGQGKGDSTDIKLAVDYYRRAASSGSLVAHSNLGFIFKENNKEFKQDLPLALKHFFIASKGNEKAREQIQKALSGEAGEDVKILAVSHMANEWPNEHYLLHEGCKTAITEIIYLSRYLKELVVLPELANEIVKKLIVTWPENHGRKELVNNQKEN